MSLAWFDMLPVDPEKWSSTVKVRIVDADNVPPILQLKGEFTSLVDDNTYPIAEFPENYKPMDFRVLCTSHLSEDPDTDMLPTVGDSTLGLYGQFTCPHTFSTGDRLLPNMTYFANTNQAPNTI